MRATDIDGATRFSAPEVHSRVRRIRSADTTYCGVKPQSGKAKSFSRSDVWRWVGHVNVPHISQPVASGHMRAHSDTSGHPTRAARRRISSGVIPAWQQRGPTFRKICNSLQQPAQLHCIMGADLFSGAMSANRVNRSGIPVPRSLRCAEMRYSWTVLDGV